MTKENLRQSIGAAALGSPALLPTATPGFLVGMGQTGRVLFIYLLLMCLLLDLFAS